MTGTDAKLHAWAIEPREYAARRDQDHNAALYNVYRSFGDVRPTDEVIEMIELADAKP